jgi:hypothetical protein
MTPQWSLQTTTTRCVWWLTEDGTLSPDRRRAWVTDRWRIDPWRWRLRLPCRLTQSTEAATP